MYVRAQFDAHTTTGQVKWALHLFSNNFKYSGLHAYLWFSYSYFASMQMHSCTVIRMSMLNRRKYSVNICILIWEIFIFENSLLTKDTFQDRRFHHHLKKQSLTECEVARTNLVNLILFRRARLQFVLFLKL